MPFLSDVNERLFLAVNEFARDTGWLHAPAAAFAKYGVVLFALLLLGAVYFYGRSSARALAAAVWTGAATLVAVAVRQPIGNAVGEHRPYVAHPHALLLISPTSDFSFPSDHAVMAGAVAAGGQFARLVGAGRPVDSGSSVAERDARVSRRTSLRRLIAALGSSGGSHLADPPTGEGLD